MLKTILTENWKKLKYLIDHKKKMCLKLYQHSRYLSGDEHMVKSEGRSGLRQYMKDQMGLLWVLADDNGYSCNFDVCTAACTEKSDNRLGYDVILKLIQPFF